MLKYSPKHKLFHWSGPGAFENRHLPRNAGFNWHQTAKCWYTASPYVAYQVRGHISSKKVHDPAADALINIHRNIVNSKAEGVDAARGLYPFQLAGVNCATRQLTQGRRSVAIFDEQGLGKTIQALGVANHMGFKKLLVVCPASLRLNWAEEIEKWHVCNPGVIPVLKGNTRFTGKQSVVTSYELAKRLKGYRPDLVIVDETHYLKNHMAQRTQLVLGNYQEKWNGLVGLAPSLLLSGTPLPNGKPDELYPVLKRCAPDIISDMSYWQYIQRFCEYVEDQGEIFITGPKNEEELYTRLRGSGFMVRRLKKDVLKDLPPKRYKMVAFHPTGATTKIIEKEKPFNEAEIVQHGVPAGSGLPELRREMGLAMMPQSARYISDLLDSGVHKVGVTAHHRDVCSGLGEILEKYKPVVYMGGLNDHQKKAKEDEFQKDPNVRVFIGNQAAREGLTLTAAHHVVDVEPEWVPGENDQRHDRYHRITQTESVLIHMLVTQGSLGAKILKTSAHKAGGITDVLDR